MIEELEISKIQKLVCLSESEGDAYTVECNTDGVEIYHNNEMEKGSMMYMDSAKQVRMFAHELIEFADILEGSIKLKPI